MVLVLKKQYPMKSTSSHIHNTTHIFNVHRAEVTALLSLYRRFISVVCSIWYSLLPAGVLVSLVCADCRYVVYRISYVYLHENV